jgi:hypothetical protein
MIDLKFMEPVCHKCRNDGIEVDEVWQCLICGIHWVQFDDGARLITYDGDSNYESPTIPSPEKGTSC